MSKTKIKNTLVIASGSAILAFFITTIGMDLGKSTGIQFDPTSFDVLFA